MPSPDMAGGQDERNGSHSEHSDQVRTGGGLIARARIAAVADGGATQITECWGQAPLLVRPTTQGVHLVGGAAGPLGGDVLDCHVDVGDRAQLQVSSVAATLVRPSRTAAPSRYTVTARVGSSGHLLWTPHPLVACSGCDHRSTVSIDLAATGAVFWVDIAVLGRHDEPGGTLISRRSVNLDGRPINRHELRLGLPAHGMNGPAVTGCARVVASCLVVNPEWSSFPWTDPSSRHNFVLSGHESDAGGAQTGGPQRDTSALAGHTTGRDARGPRVGLVPLAAAPAVEILGFAGSVGELLESWDLLATSFARRAPETAKMLRAYVRTNR